MVPSDEQKRKWKEEENQRRNYAINDAVEKTKIPYRYRGMRFMDFKVGKADQINVLDDCKDFMKDGTYDTGLLMVGRNGTGKTMLACIILFELIIMDPRNSYGYLYAEAIKIIRDIKDTWRTKTSEQEAIDSYVRPKVLVIDEIGMSYGSPTERQFLTEIINDRYNINAPTILAGNLTPKEIKEVLGDRIYDRFNEDGKCLVFNWPSYRRKSSVRNAE